LQIPSAVDGAPFYVHIDFTSHQHAYKPEHSLQEANATFQQYKHDPLVKSIELVRQPSPMNGDRITLKCHPSSKASSSTRSLSSLPALEEKEEI